MAERKKSKTAKPRSKPATKTPTKQRGQVARTKMVNVLRMVRPTVLIVITSLLRLAIAVLSLCVAVWAISIPDWHNLVSQLGIDNGLEFSKVWAWPIVVVLALVILRPNFPEMLKNGFEFFFPFGSIKVPPQQQPLGTATKEADTAKTAEIIADVEEEVQETIKAAAQTIKPASIESTAVVGTPTIKPTDLKKSLDRLANINSAAITFERANSIIYESQYRVLAFLRSYEDGVKKQDLSPFYDWYIKATPGGMDFMVYLEFLIGSKFITYDAASGIFKITTLGKDFLAYRAKNGLQLTPENQGR